MFQLKLDDGGFGQFKLPGRTGIVILGGVHERLRDHPD
jgi:hypothetical protein